MVHPVVDIEYWAKRFPSEDNSAIARPPGTWISSPRHLCQLEQVRRSAPISKLGPSVPVDLFLWNTGPAELPFQTRIGGNPYRKSSKPWPTTTKGEPYTFVAQFCFLDSLDLFPFRLPGDVLLIFQHRELDPNKSGVYTEWIKVNDQGSMEGENNPTTGDRIPELTGVRHRFNEYPESVEYFNSNNYEAAYLFPISQSTKIGSVTFFCQGDPRWRRNKPPLLCTLNSILPDSTWPFLDMEKIPGQERTKKKKGPAPGSGKFELMFGDAGSLHFFLKRSGKVKVHFDSY